MLRTRCRSTTHIGSTILSAAGRGLLPTTQLVARLNTPQALQARKLSETAKREAITEAREELEAGESFTKTGASSIQGLRGWASLKDKLEKPSNKPPAQQTTDAQLSAASPVDWKTEAFDPTTEAFDPTTEAFDSRNAAFDSTTEAFDLTTEGGKAKRKRAKSKLRVDIEEAKAVRAKAKAAKAKAKPPESTNDANPLIIEEVEPKPKPTESKAKAAKAKVKAAKAKAKPPKSTNDAEPKTKSVKAKAKAAQSKSSTGNNANLINCKSIRPKDLKLNPVEGLPSNIPSLSYGLDRVLFNEGVYRMQDRRTYVYNFDPYLASIMPVEEFDYGAIKQYITSSKDNKLHELAKKYGKKYSGSTSSMTNMLSHLHFLISNWRPPNMTNMSKSYIPDSLQYTLLTRCPVAAFIKHNEGSYSIDSDKEYDSENVLTMLGKSMELLLTLPKEEFEKYRKTQSHQLSDEVRNAGEAYHYTTFGDFLMRSQLDARDPRLPGTGVFDLKTRAVVTIRMDAQSHEKGTGYEIIRQHGEWESFEREYCDLIRAAFLKYSLQVRMGRMDGCFVAYHNTRRIFGFQYVSLQEMDHAIHGSAYGCELGDEEFRVSLVILNDLLDRATKRFPGRTLRVHMETRPTSEPLTYFFVEPVTDEQMEAIQRSNVAKVEKTAKEIQKMSCQVEAAEKAATEMAEDDMEISEEAVEDGATEVSTEEGTELAGDSELAENAEMAENSEVTEEAEEAENLKVTEEAEEVTEEAEEAESLEVTETEVAEEAENLKVTEEAEEATEELKVMEESEATKESEATEDSTSSADADTDQNDQNDATWQEVLERVNNAVESESLGIRSIREAVEDALAHTGLLEGKTEAESDKHISDLVSALMQYSRESKELQSTAEEELTKEEMENAETETSLKDLILQVAKSVDDSTVIPNDYQRKIADLTGYSKTDKAASEHKATEATEQTSEVKDDDDDADADAAPEATSEAAQDGKDGDGQSELLGMYVTVRNKVNGEFVPRPGSIGRTTKWEVQYAVVELPQERATKIYQQIKQRRKKMFAVGAAERDEAWYKMYNGCLLSMSQRGKKHMEAREKWERTHGIQVAWEKDKKWTGEKAPPLESESASESSKSESQDSSSSSSSSRDSSS